MLTKPCGRATKGCTRLIAERWPKRLERRVFCSPRCAQADKIEKGLWPAGGRVLSKPCARHDKGCQGRIIAPGPKTLAKRRFCGHLCACLYRQENGLWHHPVISREDRRRGGRKAGKASGETRRMQSVARAVAAIEPLIPKRIDMKLTEAEQRRLRILLAMAWRKGNQLRYRKRRGYSS